MPKWLKILLAVTAGGCVLFGIGTAVVVHWFKSNMGTWAEAAKTSAAEGTAFGKGQPSSACLDEAVRRLRAKSSFNDELAHKFFLRGGLAAASEPAGFCTDVPPKSEIMKSVSWALQACTQLQMSGDQACSRLVQGVQEHCHEGPLKLPPQAQPSGG